jgi:hypothetical protein
MPCIPKPGLRAAVSRQECRLSGAPYGFRRPQSRTGLFLYRQVQMQAHAGVVLERSLGPGYAITGRQGERAAHVIWFTYSPDRKGEHPSMVPGPVGLAGAGMALRRLVQWPPNQPYRPVLVLQLLLTGTRLKSRALLQSRSTPLRARPNRARLAASPAQG